MTSTNPAANLEAAINPFGLYVQRLQSVPGGWTFEIHDHYNPGEHWNCLAQDFTDKNVADFIYRIGIVQ